MKEIKNSLIIAGTFIATIIGAGFASGQEILSYFVVYGKGSVLGLLAVCILFTLCAASIMLRSYKSGTADFDEYIDIISGRRAAVFIKLCVIAFMLISFCSMSAGSGELFRELFAADRSVGIFAMLTVCTIIFLFDLKGILAVNAVLAPIMTLSLFFLGIYAFVFRTSAVFGGEFPPQPWQNIAGSSLIYASYNLLTLVVILSELGGMVTKRRVCLLASTIGGGALFAISLAIWAAIMLYYGKIPFGEMPFFSILSRYSSAVRLIYGIVVCLSMLTTAISCGYGTISCIRKKLKIKRLSAIIITIALSLPIIFLGFENIVKSVYLLFGCLGVVLLVYILRDGMRLLAKKN